MAGEPYGMGVPPDFWNTFDQQQQPQPQGNPQADLMQIAAANFQQQQQAEEERRRQEELIRAQAAAREQDKQNYIKVSAAKAYSAQDALTAQQKAAEAFDKINPPIPVATGVAPPPIDANQTFMNAQKTAQQLRDQQLQNTMQPGTVLNPQNVLPPNITAMQRRTQKLTPEQVNQNLMADNFVPTQVNGKTVWTNPGSGDKIANAKGNPSVDKMTKDLGSTPAAPPPATKPPVDLGKLQAALQEHQSEIAGLKDITPSSLAVERSKNPSMFDSGASVTEVKAARAKKIAIGILLAGAHQGLTPEAVLKGVKADKTVPDDIKKLIEEFAPRF